MAVRLIALDIDGTLTNDARRVSQENLDAVARAQAAGVFVTIATGRAYRASLPILRALNVQGPSMHYGGAWVVDTRTQQTLHLSPLSAETVHDVLQISHELNTTAQLYQENTVIFEKENPFSMGYVTKFDLPYRIVPDAIDQTFHDVPKMLMLTDRAHEAELIAAVTEKLQGRADVSRSQPGFIEINCRDVNKATGLSFIAEYLGIQQTEVAAIGDSYLDLSMIQWAGDGVCVENATKDVLKSADTVVPSCEANGVAYYIDHYVL